MMFKCDKNYSTVLFLTYYTLTILLCNKVTVTFGNDLVEGGEIGTQRVRTAEYIERLKRIAKARQSHEAKLVEVYKNEVYDNTPPKMNIAAEENPSWNDNIDDAYEHVEHGINKLRDAKPIHDTNSEAELLDTRGHLPTNQIVVDAYEGFSNFLNRAINTPFNVLQKGWNAWIRWWESLGSRLIGLDHERVFPADLTNPKN